MEGFKNKIHRITASRWIVSIGMALFFFIAFETIFALYKDRLQVANEKEAIKYGYDLAARFDRELNKLTYLSSGVEAYVKINHKNIDSTELNQILKVIYEKESGLIRNLGVGEGYVLKWVYPIVGNEKAVGLDYTKLPQQLPKVQLAIDSKIGTLDGPVELVQGGRSLIYRTPVYIDAKYWGIISTVIDLNNVFNAAFKDHNHDGFQFAISKTRKASDVDLLYGDHFIFSHPKAFIREISIPNGNWYYALVATSEIEKSSYLLVLNLLGVLATIILFLVVFYIKNISKKSSEILIKYKFLAEKSSDIIWVYNIQNSEFTYLSPSVKNLTQYEASEIHDLPMEWILSPLSIVQVKTEIPKRYRHFLKKKDSDKKYIDQFMHRGKNGQFIWAESITQFNCNDQGQVEILGVSRNIDHRKKAEIALEESEKKFKAIFDLSNDGLMLVEPDSTLIVMGNEQLFKMLRYEPRELIGKPVNVFCKDDINFCNSKAAGILDKHGIDKSKSMQVIRKDHSIFYADIKSSDIEFSDRKYMLCAFRDVTDQRELQKELIKLNDEKDRFISVLAHDLRSPFNGLIGLLDVLIQDFDEIGEREMKTILGNLFESSKNIFQLLEELLIWSRSQAGKLLLEPRMINFMHLITSITNLYKTSITRKGIVVHTQFDFDFNVFADESHLNIIMRNLISNAIKFCNEKGEVTIVANENQKEYCIEVIDNGIGMDQKTKDQLWNYTQNISRVGTDNEKGSGFGLVLTKELIERHGGTIDVQSNPANGAKFTLRFPK